MTISGAFPFLKDAADFRRAAQPSRAPRHDRNRDLHLPRQPGQGAARRRILRPTPHQLRLLHGPLHQPQPRRRSHPFGLAGQQPAQNPKASRSSPPTAKNRPTTTTRTAAIFFLSMARSSVPARPRRAICPFRPASPCSIHDPQHQNRMRMRDALLLRRGAARRPNALASGVPRLPCRRHRRRQPHHRPEGLGHSAAAGARLEHPPRQPRKRILRRSRAGTARRAQA